ncbi:hypothetical protein BGW80DRAFT_1556940 [Lactifluus volemus]|nr:hypothetical protein BGW80DRAFT_1556940 [Lactifluus volemus]
MHSLTQMFKGRCDEEVQSDIMQEWYFFPADRLSRWRGVQILAVEHGSDGGVVHSSLSKKSVSRCIKKFWLDDPTEAVRSIKDVFNGIVCQRLKDILRQYESREHHFECVIRPKELEVLLSCVREVAQQQQLAQGPLLWDDPSPPQEQLQLAHTFTCTMLLN